MTAAQTFAPPIVRMQEVEPPPLLKLSFTCFCIFLLADYSRFFEWQLIWMHVPMITSVIALAGAAIEGRLTAVFTSKVGICMSILTVLYAINIPFSTWRGGSLNMFTGEWLKTVIVFAISGALIFNIRQCRVALHSIGWASGIAGVLVNWKGEMVDGRLIFGTGSFKNANQIAFDMLLGLPLLWLIVADPKGMKVKKVIAMALMCSNFLAMIRTGSRGALIGLAILCFLFFIRSSMAAKVAMVVAGVLAIAVGLVVLPSSLKVRYATLISGSEAAQEATNKTETGVVNAAEGSSAERRRLLMASITATLTHPLLGVGIGEFAVYEVAVDFSEGRNSGWQGTHNTYTQVSSEAGIPALIVFLCLIVFSIKGPMSLSKRAKTFPPGDKVKDILAIAFALSASVLIYAVCISFDYIAYSADLPILGGLGIALVRCGNQELDRLEEAPASYQPGSNQIVNLYPVRPTRGMGPAAFTPASGPGRA